jgi:hypothetical protein
MSKELQARYAQILLRTGSSPRHLGNRGVTGVIHERYYPEYRFNGRNGVGATIASAGIGAAAAGGLGGMARGRLVDNEVQDWIHRQLKPAEIVVAAKKRSKTVVTVAKTNAERHVFSRAFIALTHKLRLRPIGAQVVCRCALCDVATLIDAVFIDKNDRVVLVELKCGFEGYIDEYTGNMQGVFRSLTNAPKNQHQIQVAFSRCMFERTFPELGPVDAIVVRMTTSGAHVSRVTSDVDKIARRVFNQNKRV